MRTLALLGLVSCLLVPVAEQADRWRAANARGNRYEGIGYRTPQSSPKRLALVSFLAERAVNQPLAAELTVRFFLPAARRDVLIVARELNPVREYRMEALPIPDGWGAGWNSFKGWRTADVLVPEAIPAGSLGVLVADPASGSRHVYAAVLQPSDAPPTTAVETYVAHLSPSFHASGGSYVIARGCDDALAQGPPIRSDAIGTQRANVTFPVKFAMAHVPRGDYTFTVRLTPRPAGTAATPPSEPPAEVSYCFRHPGPPAPDGHGRG